MAEKPKRDPRSIVLEAYENIDTPDHMDDHVSALMNKILTGLCEQLGHSPIKDQCGLREHDYCEWCSTITPGAAHNDTTAENHHA